MDQTLVEAQRLLQVVAHQSADTKLKLGSFQVAANCGTCLNGGLTSLRVLGARAVDDLEKAVAELVAEQAQAVILAVAAGGTFSSGDLAPERQSWSAVGG